MLGMAAMFSDEDMDNAPAYLAQQKAEPGAATDKDLVALGEQTTVAASRIATSPACRRLPQPQRGRHSCAISAPLGPTRPIHRHELNEFRDGTRDTTSK